MTNLACLNEAKLLEARTRGEMLAGTLVCKARARDRPSDPLVLAEKFGRSSWRQAGRKAISRAGFSKFLVEKDFKELPSDHHLHWKSLGNIGLE